VNKRHIAILTQSTNKSNIVLLWSRTFKTVQRRNFTIPWLFFFFFWLFACIVIHYAPIYTRRQDFLELWTEFRFKIPASTIFEQLPNLSKTRPSHGKNMRTCCGFQPCHTSEKPDLINLPKLAFESDTQWNTRQLPKNKTKLPTSSADFSVKRLLRLVKFLLRAFVFCANNLKCFYFLCFTSMVELYSRFTPRMSRFLK